MSDLPPARNVQTALEQRDIAALISATAEAFAMCACVDGTACSAPPTSPLPGVALADSTPSPCRCSVGLPCSLAHREPDEDEWAALLRRLKSTKLDPIGLTAKTEPGDLQHAVYGVLLEDLDVLIATVATLATESIGGRI